MLDQEKALQDPQQWNRHAYARNNQFVFIDPDGRELYRVVTPWERELMQMAGAFRDRVATALGADSPGSHHPLGVFGRNVVDSLLATVLPRDNREYVDAANAALLGGIAPMGGRFLGTTYTEPKTLVGAWGKGSFRTLSETISYRFEIHGSEVGAQNVLQDLRKSFESVEISGGRQEASGGRCNPLREERTLHH